jgi:hypothetical protein
MYCVLMKCVIRLQFDVSTFVIAYTVIMFEVSCFYFCYDALVVGINFLKPAGHVMHQQFNIQQLYALPTLYLCVLYLSENKQRLVPLTA